jgi:hypothetical protein
MMPTVLRLRGLRVAIYPADHGPAHVHVLSVNEEAVFILHCPEGPPELRDNYGFKQNDVSAIIDALTNVLNGLCQEWSRIHGTK